MNKVEICDALAIRYGWPLHDLKSKCVCGDAFSIDHAGTCPTAGYPIVRHSALRDLIADDVGAVIPDVGVEPTVLSLAGAILPGATANHRQDARLDICARVFLSRQQDAFFDVRVTHSSVSLLRRADVLSQLSRNEKQKKTSASH